MKTFVKLNKKGTPITGSVRASLTKPKGRWEEYSEDPDPAGHGALHLVKFGSNGEAIPTMNIFSSSHRISSLVKKAVHGVKWKRVVKTSSLGGDVNLITYSTIGGTTDTGFGLFFTEASGCTVDWGDGNVEDFTTPVSPLSFDCIHTYSAPGTYTVTVLLADITHVLESYWAYSSEIATLEGCAGMINSNFFEHYGGATAIPELPQSEVGDLYVGLYDMTLTEVPVASNLSKVSDFSCNNFVTTTAILEDILAAFDAGGQLSGRVTFSGGVGGSGIAGINWDTFIATGYNNLLGKGWNLERVFNGELEVVNESSFGLSVNVDGDNRVQNPGISQSYVINRFSGFGNIITNITPSQLIGIHVKLLGSSTYTFAFNINMGDFTPNTWSVDFPRNMTSLKFADLV